MKKTYLLLIPAAVGIIMAFTKADDETIDFKAYLKPHHLYTQVVTEDSHMEMTYVGTQEFLERLKEQGVANPTIKDKKEKHTSLTKTGDLGQDSKFPIVMMLDNRLREYASNDTASKIHVFGQCKMGDIPALDSVSGPDLTPEYKKVLMQAMQSTFSQIITPERHLKIGDTFTVSQPLNIPFGKNALVMNFSILYTLKKIKKDMAYFTTRESYTIKVKIENMPITADGSGKGEFEYDIPNNFYKHSLLRDTLNMNLNYEGFSMKSKSYINSGFDETIADY